MAHANPLAPGMGLPDARLFVGRRRELALAREVLGRPRPGCLELVGASRMGKTTLLDQIMRSAGAGRAGSTLQVALGPVQVRDRERMFRPLARRLAAVLTPGTELPESACGGDGFLEWLESVATRPVVVFWDDFDDLMFAADSLRCELYNNLRAATWQLPVAFCLTVRRPLAELCEADGQPASLLWNVFTTVSVGLLAADAARELVHGPLRAAGQPVSGEEWDTLFAETGPHAFFLQIAGQLLCQDRERAGADALSGEHLQRFENELHDTVSRFFPALLEWARERGENVLPSLSALAGGARLAARDADALVRLGLARETAQGVALLSDSFADHVRALAASVPVRGAVVAGGRLPEEGGAAPPAPAYPGVFLCHASADRSFTERLCRDLQTARADVWTDWLHIPPGAMFDREIEAALKAATHVVLVVSPAAVASDYVRAEVEFALKSRKTVIPVMHQPADVPPRWYSLQYIDATSGDAYASALARLAGVLPRVADRLAGGRTS